MKGRIRIFLWVLFLMILVSGGIPGLLKAQNPISPPGVYLADPSVRIWDDSVLYFYTSTDSSGKFYCS